MTRINVVPVEELTNKHLMGEYHEITRVPNLVKKRLSKNPNKWSFPKGLDQPKEYTLGTGHVKFFYDKLSYIANRYTLLSKELIQRGYNVNPIPLSGLLNGVPEWLMGDYEPTKNALLINRQRIKERL